MATTRELSPRAQFSALLSRFPPEIVTLAKKCLLKLRRAFPVAYELIYDYPHSVLVTFSMSERGYEGIISLAILQNEVKLYFDKSLPDPKKLLEGTGSKVRSVAIKSAANLDKGDIHDLLQAAIRHSGVKFPKTGSRQMVIKSHSKKKAKKAGAP